MVTIQDCRMCNLGSRPGQGHCFEFFDETLHSYGTSVHPDAEQNTNPVMTTVASHLESRNSQMK